MWEVRNSHGTLVYVLEDHETSEISYYRMMGFTLVKVEDA